MRTVTLDILNEKAINLLKDLEMLKHVRFRQDSGTTSNDSGRLNLKDFSFSKSRKVLKDYKGSLSESAAEERRNEQ